MVMENKMTPLDVPAPLPMVPIDPAQSEVMTGAWWIKVIARIGTLLGLLATAGVWIAPESWRSLLSNPDAVEILGLSIASLAQALGHSATWVLATYVEHGRRNANPNGIPQPLRPLKE